VVTRVSRYPRVNRDTAICLKGEASGLTFRNFDIEEMDFNPTLLKRKGVSAFDLCIFAITTLEKNSLYCEYIKQY